MVTVAALGLTHRCERWVPSTMTSPRPSGIGVRALRPTVYEVTRHLPFSDSKVSPVATSRFPKPTAHDPPLTPNSPYEGCEVFVSGANLDGAGGGGTGARRPQLHPGPGPHGLAQGGDHRAEATGEGVGACKTI